MNIKSLFSIAGKRQKTQLPFDLLFKRFRDVLDSHNKALEVITEMGEKLGGEYLFDIIYLRNAYSRLFNAVQDTVQYFDALTQNRYSKLRVAVKRIDDRITGVIYDLPPASGKDVVFYEDITWDMSREVGGKNAGLAEVKKYLKMDIPTSFAITTHAYDQFMAHNNLAERIESIGKQENVKEEILAGLRDAIVMSEIPPRLDSAIDSALRKLALEEKGSLLAVRSSAEEEDGEFSFAGQFETMLNVPLENAAVKKAYKEVIASLFSAKSIAYQKSLGYGVGRLRMAVGCMVMVDALSSGVIYTISPGGDRQKLMIRATWGLGSALVEGQTDSDLYLVSKGDLGVVEQKIAGKEFIIIPQRQGGTEKTKTAPEISHAPCLTPAQIREISGLAISMERHFRKPLDIEWAIDRKGKIYILQSRPLIVPEAQNDTTADLEDMERHRIIMEKTGEAVVKGIGAGRVFIVRHMDEIDKFPKGAVLVAANDSSNFVRIMPYASAIITDTGSPASHMSSISREFRVPTLVNTGNATKLLKHGQEVTIGVGDDGNAIVYEGIVKGLLNSTDEKRGMERVFEYRRKRYVLKYVSPLNLVDPLTENFTPDKCKTLHDVLRFIHEKAVSELIENAGYTNSMLKKQAAVKLDLPIPAGIMLIDIGGGLKRDDGSAKVTFENISSIPLRALIGGMLHPGVWHSEAVPLKMNDFISSMMRMSDITSSGGKFAGYNVAVTSAEYLNLSLRFGYHFNMLDCYCSRNARNNHIYFRFVGGATDIVKRTRRVELIAAVLKEFGFTIMSRGDLITARLANIGRNEMIDILDQLGRLIAYTRQLDAVLHDTGTVERRTKDFLEQKYG